MAFPIDIGAVAIDQAATLPALYTFIDTNNPANLSGLITSVEVWAATNLTGFRIGVFYLVSGTTYRCRSSATIDAVTAGSKQTFSVSLPVQKGDFIGCYFDTGTIEANTSTGTWIGGKAGEYIDPGDSAVFTTATSNGALSLYGQGIVRGWSSK